MFLINPFVFAVAGAGIEETFQSYADGGDVTLLSGGTGWAAVAVISTSPEVMADETFQTYSDGGNVNSMSAGSNWAGAAVVT